MTSELSRATAAAIEAQRAGLAAATVAAHYAERPEQFARYGAHGRAKCLEDAAYHLAFLAEAVATEAPALFLDYLGWAKVLLAQLGIPVQDLAHNLQCMRLALTQLLPPPQAAVAGAVIDSGLQSLDQLPAEVPTFMEGGDPQVPMARAYVDALLRGDRHSASRMVLDAAESGVAVQAIYLNVFQRSQYEIGRLWQMNKITVAQEHYCSAATQLIMSLLYPRIFRTERNGHALVAACVHGDLHEIGMRIVTDFFEMEGWDTFYLGANTPTPGIVDALVQHHAEILALSATMSFHVRAVAEVIAAVRASEACRDVKIMVGGYPFNLAPSLWREVGADGYAVSAADVVGIANGLLAPGRAP